MLTYGVTVYGYARAVYKFSKLSTGIGCVHDRLSRFFSGLLAIRNRTFDPPIVPEEFLTQYGFDLKDESSLSPPDSTESQSTRRNPPNSRSSKWQLRRPKHFQSCQDFAQHPIPPRSQSPGQVFFLRGFPSPEWLGLIGCTYRVDPEFFNRFLDLRSAHDRSNYFSVPSLPSNGWNIIDLSLITLGIRNSTTMIGQPFDLVAMRADCNAALLDGHNHVLRGGHVPVGSTLIRNLNVLDETHFAIEQRISVYLHPPENDRGWVSKSSRILCSAWLPCRNN